MCHIFCFVFLFLSKRRQNVRKGQMVSKNTSVLLTD